MAELRWSAESQRNPGRRMNMSDVQQGADWWLAVDGRWYPPERHPNYRPPVTGSNTIESRPATAASRDLSAPPATSRIATQPPNRSVRSFEYRAASFWSTAPAGLPPADEPITQWLNGPITERRCLRGDVLLQTGAARAVDGGTGEIRGTSLDGRGRTSGPSELTADRSARSGAW